MRIIAHMSRLPCARVAAFLFTAVLVTSCGGNPPPRPAQRGDEYRQPVSNNPPGPVRVAAIPATPPPPIAGESAIVVDVVSGRVLYAKNADLPRAVASTQKIVTALCVLDAGNVDKQVVIEPSDGACEPTKLGLKPGDKLRLTFRRDPAAEPQAPRWP